MTETMQHLTTRVPVYMLDALDEQAKQRRMQTGGNVSRADLVREAIDSMVKGDMAAAPAVVDDDDPHDYGAIVLSALEELADEADRQGIEDDPQGFGMAIWPTAEGDPRLERLLAIASKIHGVLRAV
jgi:hypothetical protein